MEGKRCIAKQKADDLISRYQGLIKGIHAYIKYLKEKAEMKSKK